MASSDDLTRDAADLGQVHEHLDEPLRGAPQRERIARAGRLLTGGEQAHQRVDAIGDRHAAHVSAASPSCAAVGACCASTPTGWYW